MLVSPLACAITDIAITADRVRGDGFALKQASLRIKQPLSGEIKFDAAEMEVGANKIKSPGFACAQLLMGNNSVACDDSKIALGKDNIPVSFKIDLASKHADFKLQPTAEESLSGSADLSGADWSALLNISNGNIKRVAEYIPAGAPKPTQGTLSGSVKLKSHGGNLQIDPDVTLGNFHFSDKDGLRAGEKIAAALKGTVVREGTTWRFNTELDYRSGEALWTPLYIEKGGHKLRVNGSYDDKALRIENANLQMADIGVANISLAWDIPGDKMADFRINGKGIQLDNLYKVILKPYLEKTSFGAMTMKGNGDIDWAQTNGQLRVFDLTLRDAQMDDTNNRFSVSGLQLELPWKLDEKRDARIRFASAKMLNVPLGAVDTPVSMNGYDFSMPRLILPVFDGKLEIKNFKAAEVNGEWNWKFSGGLSPLSLTNLTKTMKLPELSGNISGEIPEVEYANNDVKMRGALVVQLLGGFAIIKDVALYRPLGDAPRFTADVDAHNLDLALMTTAFSFGKMQGLVDLRIANMELVKWKPVQMEAALMSSPGDYAKKISQQAVQNISALGGAGAAAAIQRSFLSFFEQFGYEKLGLSCKLRNNICEMGGVESTPQGYVIVKGGGIPAITVMGYNRTVGWQEFLDRVTRITQENAKPVIQ